MDRCLWCGKWAELNDDRMCSDKCKETRDNVFYAAVRRMERGKRR